MYVSKGGTLCERLDKRSCWVETQHSQEEGRKMVLEEGEGISGAH